MVRLTDRPDMTLDVYRGRKTTNQQQQSKTHVFEDNLTKGNYLYDFLFASLDGIALSNWSLLLKERTCL